MRKARRFIIEPYELKIERSTVEFHYRVELEDGTSDRFTDRLSYSGVTSPMWQRIPRPILRRLLEGLAILHSDYYWKIDCAPKIEIEGFSLTKGQAQFWTELYTKGMGEFFYRAGIDHRGLISFPHRFLPLPAPKSVCFARRPRVLLLNGGGKDSIVSAEFLSASGVPFALYTQSGGKTQRIVADLIGAWQYQGSRKRDGHAKALRRQLDTAYGGLFGAYMAFSSLLAAALWDFRFVAFSNEASADWGNLEYLGLEVNHQWTKSREAERMLRSYVHRYISPDLDIVSLARPYTEIEMTRRFAAFPKYFQAFRSCNDGFHRRTDEAHSGWCNACAKCAFMFACLSAFLPKSEVLSIFGKDLYEDETMVPVFLELLGVEGHKPFECVGSPEESMVALHRADLSGAYEGSAVLRAFRSRVPQDLAFGTMEARVLAPQCALDLPKEFAQI